MRATAGEGDCRHRGGDGRHMQNPDVILGGGHQPTAAMRAPVAPKGVRLPVVGRAQPHTTADPVAEVRLALACAYEAFTYTVTSRPCFQRFCCAAPSAARPMVGTTSGISVFISVLDVIVPD